MNTGKDIQRIICKREVLSHKVVCENIELLLTAEMDVAALSKNDMLTEYEVKISRSDFRADAQKRKWKFYTAIGQDGDKYRPNYFYYACPPDLIKVEDVPDFAGLIYVSEDSFYIVKKAKRLHPNRCDREKLLTKICRVQSERMYLGCCRMTYENRLIQERYEKSY